MRDNLRFSAASTVLAYKISRLSLIACVIAVPACFVHILGFKASCENEEIKLKSEKPCSEDGIKFVFYMYSTL